MSGGRIFLQAFGWGLAAIMAGSGCEALHNAGVPGMEPYVKEDPEVVEKVRSQKELFALHRDHKAFYWLLANKISTGMEMSDVEEVLGEPGELTTDFSRVKSDGSRQITDPAYRWGTDNQGYSAILFFRDGHLMNFDPKDFRTP